MPSEKFYPPYEDAVEHLDIQWHQSYPEVFATMVHDRDGTPHAVGIPLDRSAINRMIRTLRKARDQTYGSDE